MVGVVFTTVIAAEARSASRSLRGAWSYACMLHLDTREQKAIVPANQPGTTGFSW
jgi:hypothetical protein